MMITEKNLLNSVFQNAINNDKKYVVMEIGGIGLSMKLVSSRSSFIKDQIEINTVYDDDLRNIDNFNIQIISAKSTNNIEEGVQHEKTTYESKNL